MQLRRIRVRNIRSYESADLTLGPGTTLISGDVGAGKTSLLYAIEMALFGFAEVDPAYLVRHQVGESEVVLGLEDAEHRYEFSRRFRRRRRKGRDVFELESASFSTDGATSSYSVTEIRQRAISLLGFPDNPNPRAHSDLWRWAVYVPQERMREVLAQEPDERLETVRKALGLEQYRTAADNAQLLAAELRRMADRAEAEARGRDHLVDEQPALVQELAERESQGRAAALDRDRHAGDLRGAEAHVAELEARRQSLERDRGEEDQLLDRSRSDEERLVRLKSRGAELDGERTLWTQRRETAAPLAERRKETEAELRRLDDRIGALRADREERSRDIAALAATEARWTSARDSLAHAQTEASRSEKESVSAAEDLRRLLAEGPQHEPPAPTRRSIAEIDAALEAARARSEQRVADASRLEHIAAENDELLTAGVCPRCHQKVDPTEFAAHFTDITSELSAARADLSELRATTGAVSEERKARERYERTFQRWSDLESARRTARERADRADASRHVAVDRVTALERALAVDAEERERLRPRAEGARAKLEELGRVESTRTELERAIARLDRELEEARGAEAALDRIARDLTAWGVERTDLLHQQAERRAALERTRARLAVLPALIEQTRAAHARRDAVRAEGAQTDRAYERARTLSETAQTRLAELETLLAERQERLDAATRHRDLAAWFNQVFREAVLALEHRLLARAQAEFEREFSRFFTILVEDPGLIARCDAGFSPAVEIDGEWTPAEALSGGERTALALAFRLALGQVVRAAGRLRLETLILDEPTDGFSPEQVVRMGELLDGLGLPQVLLVSHESQLTAIADRVVRVQKDGGRSVLLLGDGEAVANASADSPSPGPPLATRRRVRTPRLDAPEPGPT